MEKINTIDLRKEMVETVEGKNYYNDLVNIQENGKLHLGSYDFGPSVNKSWGNDYEFDVYIDLSWKDSILLLLMKDHFETTMEFKNWIDSKGIPCETSLW